MTAKRKHRNTPRLTAKERARSFFQGLAWAGREPGWFRWNVFSERALIKLLADHARETLARYKRRAARQA